MAGEPSPALRALFDLPLKHEVTADLTARIEQLAQSAKGTDPEQGDWLPIYDQAIATTEALIEDVGERIDEIQRTSLDGDDPMEIKQRFLNTPRKEAETAINEVKGALQKASKTCIDRAKRQLDHVSTQCYDAAKGSVQLNEAQGEVANHLVVEESWWSEISGYALRCADEWSHSAQKSGDKALTAATSKALVKLMKLTKGDGLRPPAEPEALRNEVDLGAAPPPIKLTVPTFMAALGKYVRTRVMAVGIFGTALTVLFVILAGVFQGDETGEGAAGGRGGASSMMIRGGLMLAVLPLTIIFGYMAVRKERSEQMAEALESGTTATLSHTKKALDKAFEGHRGAIERWFQARLEDWLASLDLYWSENVGKALGELEKEGAGAVAEAKLRQTKSNEKLSTYRSLKNQLSQSLLFDLKRQNRDLRARANDKVDVVEENDGGR